MLNKARTILSVAVLLSTTTALAFAGSTHVEYDALGGKENGGDSFRSGGKLLVDRVLTTTGGTLGSVTVFVKLTKGDLGSFRVVGAQVAEGTNLPGRVVTLAVVQDSTLTPGKFAEVTITPDSPVSLKPGTAYYVGIARNTGGRSSVVLGNTLAPTVLARPSVVAGADYYNNGGVQPNSGGPYQIRVIVDKR